MTPSSGTMEYNTLLKTAFCMYSLDLTAIQYTDVFDIAYIVIYILDYFLFHKSSHLSIRDITQHDAELWITMLRLIHTTDNTSW